MLVNNKVYVVVSIYSIAILGTFSIPVCPWDSHYEHCVPNRYMPTSYTADSVRPPSSHDPSSVVHHSRYPYIKCSFVLCREANLLRNDKKTGREEPDDDSSL